MRTLFLSLIWVIVIFPISANAQTVVNTTADTTDATDGVTTLREAVEFANITAGVQTITFDPSVFSAGSDTVIYLDSALYLTDLAGVIITGVGAEVILDGGEPAPGDTTLPDTIFYSGLVLMAGNSEISNLYFQNFGVAGIEVDSSTVNHGNNKFTRNEIWFSGTGILANTSDNNQFAYNNIHDNINSGIEVDFSANNLFRGNLLAFNGYDGLTIFKGTGGNNIEDNTVIGNGNDGLSLSGGRNNNNLILRNNIGDSSFVPVILVPALQTNKSAGGETEIIDRVVDRKTLLTLRSVQQKARLRSVELSESRTERKSVSRKTQLAISKDKNSGAQIDAVKTRERREKIAAVRPTVSAEGGLVFAASGTGNGNVGINLYGVNQTTIEDNLIFGSDYVGLYIEGFFKIDTTYNPPIDTTMDTTFYFPYDIYVNDNRFVRNNSMDIEFCYIESMDVTNNSFVQSSTAIYGYGSFGQFNSSPAITGGIVNVINNDNTSSTGGDSGYFFGAFNLYKANMHDNIITSVYAATDLENIAVINISYNRFENTAYAVYVDFIDSLFVHNNYIITGYQPFEVYTDSGYMEIMYNELSKSEYGMDISGCFLCPGKAIISHNTIQGTVNYGITVYDMGYVEVTDNYINEVNDFGLSLADIDVAHIYRNEVSIGVNPMLAVYDVDSLYIEDNIFMGGSDDNVAEISTSKWAFIKNNIFRDSYDGVEIGNVDSLYFGYNEVANSMNNGLYLHGIDYGLIDYNEIFNHMYTGMEINRSQNMMIEKNNVTVNGDDGIHVSRSSSVDIRYNTVIDNRYYGVYSSSDTNITIDENFISLNGRGIHISSGDVTSTQQANHNSFFRNFEYGIFSNIAFDGKHNFWGHPDGPTFGDSVNVNVDADSFSTTWEFVPLHSPVAKVVEPRGGPREGNIRGKIHGALFLPGVEVFFGGTKANLVDYYASNVLEFDLPAGFGGPVDVIVKNTLNNRSDTLFAGFFYDNESPAAATLVLPANNSNVSSLDVKFSWQKPVDPDGDALEYTLIYTTDEDFPDSSTVNLERLTSNIITLSEPLLEETSYYWKVLASDTRTGISESVVFAFKTDIITGLENEDNLPKVFSLSQNYPNPFNPTTTINYALPKDADVRLVVYNLLGQEVAVLVNNKVSAGFQAFNWDARNMASGVYIYQIRAGDFLKTRKMVLLK